MNIVFRADASSIIGSGHVMRCLALAETLAGRGGTVSFVCRELPGNLCNYIENKGFEVLRVPFNPDFAVEPGSDKYLRWLGESREADMKQTRTLLSRFNGNIDWLIVDHYAINITWEQLMRPYARKLTVIDDLADRPHDCDILVNQNLHQDPVGLYSGLVPRHCRQLIGPSYALLRREFSSLHDLARQNRRSSVKRILIFFGGADPANLTTRAINAVTDLDIPGLYVDVVAGTSNPHHETIRALCGEYPNITFHYNTENMAQLMLKADLSVGAGGGATWERCCLGLPTLAARTEDNQNAIVSNASRIGVIADIGTIDDIDPARLAAAIQGIINDKQSLITMSERGRSLVDGFGCERLARHMDMKHYRITVISGTQSWINRFLPGMVSTLTTQGHHVNWVHSIPEIEQGDFAFILGFGRVVPEHVLSKNRHNLVVHESGLPHGKGWSPLSWQILEGKRSIPITLFEARAAVDSGDIYLQDTLEYEGHELVEELRALQARKTIELCLRFVDRYPESAVAGKRQTGESSYYPRRTPLDSKLNPDKSIREQMNLLRIVDNDLYPAFFEIDGIRYRLRIAKE